MMSLFQQIYTRRRVVITQIWLALALLLCWQTSALAQNRTIRLFAASETYTPGEDVTVYVYFLHSSSMGFMEQNIRNNSNFRVTSRSLIHRHIDRRTGKAHLLFRAKLRPLSSASSLRYGPLRIYSFMGMRRTPPMGNALTFKRAKSGTTHKQFKTRVLAPTGKLTMGEPFSLTYELTCPYRVCDYMQLGEERTRRILQNRFKVQSSTAFSIPQTSIRPSIEYRRQAQPPSTLLRFRYKVYPLRPGSAKTPLFKASFPVIERLDQRKALQQIHKWLRSKGISQGELRQYAQMDRPIKTSLVLRTIQWPQRDLTIQASQGLRGQWQLTSQIAANGGNTFWKVSLAGRGTLSLTASTFRQQLAAWLKQHQLNGKVALAHQYWELPDQQIDGRLTLHAYFRFAGARVTIPALQMRFLDAKGAAYARKTQPLTTTTAAINDSLPLSGSGAQRKLYTHYFAKRAPTTTKISKVTVWGVQLPAGFPTQQVLAQRWKTHTASNMEDRQVGTIQNTVRRRYRTPFGIHEQIISRPQGVEASVSEPRVSVRNDGLAVFPKVRWGSEWIFVHQKASTRPNTLTLTASTDRKHYFAGEKVEYTLRLRCAKRVCTSPIRKFFQNQLLTKMKALTVPSFSQFSEPRLIEQYKMYNLGNAYEFRYRMQFRAPQSKLEIQEATLRMEERVLRSIYRQTGICIFPAGSSSRSVLFQIVASDHYNKNVNNDDRCHVGTRNVTADALNIPIKTLPEQAKGIQLIGSFRISATLSQMTFPNKNTTIADKPFYLNITVSGDGDIKTARELMRDQMATLSRQLRKRSVTSYIETPTDKADKNALTLQVQMIGEEPGEFTIPSLKLKYFHREEGVLTAQTLPFKIKITPRVGGAAAIPIVRRAPAKKGRKRNLQTTTDLRPNRVLSANFATSRTFSLRDWDALLMLLGGPFLFFLFLVWHKLDLKRGADPQQSKRNKALRQFTNAIKGAKQDFGKDAKDGARATIDALQRYLIERLSLHQKQLTASEIEEILQPYAATENTKEATKGLLEQLGQLEGSLYGGDAIKDAGALLTQLEQHIRSLDRSLPKSNPNAMGTNQ